MSKTSMHVPKLQPTKLSSDSNLYQFLGQAAMIQNELLDDFTRSWWGWLVLKATLAGTRNPGVLNPGVV